MSESDAVLIRVCQRVTHAAQPGGSATRRVTRGYGWTGRAHSQQRAGTIMPRHTYLPLSVVADEYGISTRTLRRRIADGTLPAYRVGGQVRVREADLEQLARRIPACGVR